MFKGVIFDFNGTLFWDTGLHNKASRKGYFLYFGQNPEKCMKKDDSLEF